MDIHQALAKANSFMEKTHLVCISFNVKTRTSKEKKERTDWDNRKNKNTPHSMKNQRISVWRLITWENFSWDKNQSKRR